MTVMNINKLVIYALVAFTIISCNSNTIEAEKQIPTIIAINDSTDSIMNVLDSIYTSAMHADTALAVFKSDSDQQKMFEAYSMFLQDFGSYLTKNNFKWEKEVHCWNRFYFNKDGAVEHYMYHFNTPLEKTKEDNYKALFAKYIQNHKIGITANRKFAQCSPVTFMDN